MSDFVFPLDEYGHVSESAQFRVLHNALVYGDLAPGEVQGQQFAKRGDVITFYAELRVYPDRIQLLIDRGFVEYVPPPQEFKPRRSERGSVVTNEFTLKVGDEPKQENE